MGNRRNRNPEKPNLSANIIYKTDEIAKFYAANRRRWDELYPSERWIFERGIADAGNLGHVLDVGCAVGGLALALSERKPLKAYTGIDINERAVALAKTLDHFPMPTEFISGDILACPELANRQFDTVVALGVADFNLATTSIIEACWRHVAPGGRLVISLRMTPEQGVQDIAASYQFIQFSGDVDESGERAPYTVQNSTDALVLLRGMQPVPRSLLGYGYWGAPSATARTPFKRIVFSVFALTKPAAGESADGRLELHLPIDALA